MIVIDCGDILLREYIAEDADALYEITCQPEVQEFLPDFNSTREQRHDWVINYEIPANNEFLSALPEIGEEMYLRLSVTLKETGQMIGFVMTGCKEGLPAPNREIVYAISKDYSGMGYISKAATGLISFLFARTNVEVLNGLALPQNIGSNRLLKKCGFQLVSDVTIKDQSFYHYILRKRDWKNGESVSIHSESIDCG